MGLEIVMHSKKKGEKNSKKKFQRSQKCMKRINPANFMKCIKIFHVRT
jgi:hypothetical protein